MKKLAVVSLFGLLIMAFTATVYAQKLEFKASGFIESGNDWGRNMTTGNAAAGLYQTVSSTYLPGGAAYDETNAWMRTRARLKFDAVMEKNLSGTIFFEMDSTRWGETGDGRNKIGYFAGDRAGLEIKNVFVDFGLPYFGIEAPMTMRVGLQPLNIRPNMFVLTDGMGITGGIKADPVTIAPLWFKALENKDYASDDADVYGLHVFGKVDTFTLGGYGLYYNMNTYPLADVTPTNRADFWWIGAYLDGKAGPVSLNFDLIHDTGKVESRTAGVRDVDYRGWATRFKIDYPWEKFNFGMVCMYATGADARKTSSTGLPGSLTSTGAASTKVSSYVMPPASEAFAVFTEGHVFYGTGLDQTSTGIGIAGNYTSVSRGTIGGTWMAKLYSSYKATPWYKVTLQGLYIGDTTKNGNTVGTARKADGTTLRNDKTIGWEFDLINEFEIYKNLKYTIAAGFMTVGDGLEYWDSAARRNDKPKTPWSIISQLMYTF